MTPHRDELKRSPNPNGPFVFKRYFHARHNIMPSWIYYNFPRDLRESTPIPHALHSELKPGFYFPELIH